MRNIKSLRLKGRQPLDEQAQDIPTSVEAPSAGPINPLMAQPLEKSPSVKPQGSDTKAAKGSKKPHPLLDPPVLATAALLVLTGEVVLWASVGLLWAIVINVTAVGLFFLVVSMWRRHNARGKRTKGSLLDRLMRQPGGGGGPGGRARTPGGGGGAGGGPRGGLRGLLDRLSPRGRGTNKKDAKARQPGADSSAPRKPGGGGRPGIRWPFSRSNRPSKNAPGGNGAKPKDAAGGRTPGKAKDTASKAVPKPSPKPVDGVASRAGQDFLAGLRGEHDKEKEAKEKPTKDAADGEQKPAAEPRHVSTEKRTEAPTKESTMVQHQEDASLQRWGRNLKTISPAIEDLAKAADGTSELADAIATGVSKLAQQGEDDLPAHKTLTAEAAAIAAELKTIQADNPAARLRSLAARAEALGITYRQQHETDEARLAGERGSRAREKRADVTNAEQDT